MAMQIAKSAAGSVIFNPPVIFTKTSWSYKGSFNLFVRTATKSINLLLSTPVPTLLGMGEFVLVTKAWISINRGLKPLTVTVTAEPGALTFCSTKILEGFLTSIMPDSSISKIPISSVGPNLFLVERRILNWFVGSPSSQRTTSTRCSSVRGPATVPSLVTWPTKNMGMCKVLASLWSLWAVSLTWEIEPGAESKSPVSKVWTESTITRLGFKLEIVPIIASTSVSFSISKLDFGFIRSILSFI